MLISYKELLQSLGKTLKLFLDNDILLKLGSLGFLNELANIFDTNSSSIFILPTAFHYIKNNKKLRVKYSEENLQNILTIIKNYFVIPDYYIDDDRFTALADIERIDSGERVLFALNPPDKDFLILTGDKKSLEQLSIHLGDNKIIDDLNGKIVCLEYVISKLLKLKGFDIVTNKMKETNFAGDTGMKLIFNQQSLTLEKLNEGLISFFNEIKSKTKNLLCLLE